MATTTRFGLRAAQQTFRQPLLRQNVQRFTQRRTLQSAAENSATIEAKAEQTGFAKLWNSPIGPKTVHFWAPIMKVCHMYTLYNHHGNNGREVERGGEEIWGCLECMEVYGSQVNREREHADRVVFTVGSRPSRRRRLRPPRLPTFPLPERRFNGDRPNLDPLVLRHQTQELVPR